MEHKGPYIIVVDKNRLIVNWIHNKRFEVLPE